jgi:aspartate aminotransferase
MATVNPGDEVIIPTPYWVSYKPIADFAEAKVVYITTLLEDDFKGVNMNLPTRFSD